MNTYRKHNTYGTLKQVMLGTYFYPEFFNSIKDKKVKNTLQKIAHEVNEDLENFESILKHFGCNVLRSAQVHDQFDFDNVYQAPLAVRNTHCVIGDTLYQINHDHDIAVQPILQSYCSNIKDLSKQSYDFFYSTIDKAQSNYNQAQDLWYSSSKYHELAGADWPNYVDFVQNNYTCSPHIAKEIQQYQASLTYENKEFGPLQAPNLIVLQDKIYVDAVEYCDYASWLRPHITDSRPIEQFTSGAQHVDGCFIILNSNTIIGIDPLIDYKKYFPDHQVIALAPESYQNKIKEFKIMEQKVGGRWWVPGEENNDRFINFVENHLQSWLGYAYESIFDVNVLVLDETTVCVSNITDDVATEFKKRNIDYIVVPWRHRFFVDNGLHCISLDLYRE